MNAPASIKQSIVSALTKALPELESAKKNKANPAFKSKYADLAAIIEALEPIAAHGLWYRQTTHESADGVCVETIYIHEGGEELSAGSVFMPATKKDAQGFGSALTYARRYSLQTAFGLAVEDDDGNAAVKAQEPKVVSKAQEGQSQQGGGNPQPDAISSDQLTKLQMLIKATSSNEIAFLRAMGAPDGARICNLPRSLFSDAENKLNAKLAKMTKAETNARQVEQTKTPEPAPFGEMLDDEIPF